MAVEDEIVMIHHAVTDHLNLLFRPFLFQDFLLPTKALSDSISNAATEEILPFY
jgi:hypothetical protein